MMFSWITILKNHIFCLNETHLNLQISQISSFIDSTNYSSINACGRDDTMIVYDHYTILTLHETFTTLGVEYIATIFDGNTSKIIHVIVVYKPPTLLLSAFIIHLQKFKDVMQLLVQQSQLGTSTLTCFNKTQHNQMNFIVLCTIMQWNSNL